MKLKRLHDGTIINENGTIIEFSKEKLLSEIIYGECCLICGAHPNSRSFNREHILPNWILKKYNLFNTSIGLPNQKKKSYAEYTIACCSDCNTLMSATFENEISKQVELGFDSFSSFVKNGAETLVFQWICLIFLKMHLKDYEIKYEPDTRRNNPNSIAEQLYDIEAIHFIHIVARSFYTNAKWMGNVCGTLKILKSADISQGFNLRDNYQTKTILLKLGEITIIANLTDSKQCGNLIEESLFQRIGPINDVQGLEIAAYLCVLQMRLISRPKFNSGIKSDMYYIFAFPTGFMQFHPGNSKVQGNTIWEFCKHILERSPISSETIQLIRDGKYTFLWNSDGNFLSHG